MTDQDSCCQQLPYPHAIPHTNCRGVHPMHSEGCSGYAFNHAPPVSTPTLVAGASNSAVPAPAAIRCSRAIPRHVLISAPTNRGTHQPHKLLQVHSPEPIAPGNASPLAKTSTQRNYHPANLFTGRFQRSSSSVMKDHTIPPSKPAHHPTTATHAVN